MAAVSRPSKVVHTYFDLPARGFVSRVCFRKSGVAFEEKRLTFAEWPTLKRCGAGRLPAAGQAFAPDLATDAHRGTVPPDITRSHPAQRDAREAAARGSDRRRRVHLAEHRHLALRRKARGAIPGPDRLMVSPSPRGYHHACRPGAHRRASIPPTPWPRSRRTRSFRSARVPPGAQGTVGRPHMRQRSFGSAPRLS